MGINQSSLSRVFSYFLSVCLIKLSFHHLKPLYQVRRRRTGVYIVFALAVPVSSVMILAFLTCPLIPLGQQPFSLLAASLYLPRRPRLPFRVSPTALGATLSTIISLGIVTILGWMFPSKALEDTRSQAFHITAQASWLRLCV